MSASSRVVFAATVDAGLAQLVGGVLGGGGAEHRPAGPRPGAGGGGQDAGLAGARRADDHLGGAAGGERVLDGGGLVQPQPALRDSARVRPARVPVAAPRAAQRQRRDAARPARAADAARPCVCACATSSLFGGQLRGGRVPRGAGPGVDAAAVQLAPQRRRQRRPLAAPPATPPARFAPTAPHRPARPAAPARLLRAQVPGLGRHHQGELFQQVVPGPGGTVSRTPGPAPSAARAACASRDGGPAGSRPPGSPPLSLPMRSRPGRACSILPARCRPAHRRWSRPTAGRARPSRSRPRSCRA